MDLEAHIPQRLATWPCPKISEIDQNNLTTHGSIITMIYSGAPDRK
jgi:hypothetical protein